MLAHQCSLFAETIGCWLQFASRRFSRRKANTLPSVLACPRIRSVSTSWRCCLTLLHRMLPMLMAQTRRLGLRSERAQDVRRRVELSAIATEASRHLNSFRVFPSLFVVRAGFQCWTFSLANGSLCSTIANLNRTSKFGGMGDLFLVCSNSVSLSLHTEHCARCRASRTPSFSCFNFHSLSIDLCCRQSNGCKPG